MKPESNQKTELSQQAIVIAQVLSKTNPLHHYTWGEGCDGWTFVDEDSLSIKLERMPPGTSETRHYHQFAQQFFYILKGVADFEIETEHHKVRQEEGIQIKAGQKHRISNTSSHDLEFLLCSQPSTRSDRIHC
jgi:mannose-6-phosphate isomerase-like protein (cupin superfamily)